MQELITYGCDVGHWRNLKELFGRKLALYATAELPITTRVRERSYMIGNDTNLTNCTLHFQTILTRMCLSTKKELLFPPCFHHEVLRSHREPSLLIKYLAIRDGLWLEIDGPVAEIAEGPLVRLI